MYLSRAWIHSRLPVDRTDHNGRVVLVIDNYDSFTYNLVQYLAQCGQESHVVRNDQVTLGEIVELSPGGILLSPGPGTPQESGVCRDLCAAALREDLGPIPLFGVCLGHQTIGEVAGAVVRRAKTVMHGKTSLIEHDGHGVFQELPQPAKVTRYHSLVVEEATLPPAFVVTARSLDDGEVMGIRHKTLPIEGVQFHPESIMTEGGMLMVANFARQVAARQ